MNLDLLPNENIVNICNFLNFEELNNFRLISNRYNHNVKYFLDKKLKEIKAFVKKLNDHDNLIKINDFSDYYLLNLIWHLMIIRNC